MHQFHTDRREAPLYSVSDAADYLSMAKGTLRAWIGARQMTTRRGDFYPPVLEFVDQESRLLSFFDLTEAYILRGALESGASLKRIRRGLAYLKQQYPNNRRPLLTLEFRTNGKDLLVKGMLGSEDADARAYVNASKNGQLEMTAVIESHLRLIRHDDVTGLPNSIFPESGNRVVSISPGILSGRPTIEGTRIPTSIIAQRFRAGESFADLAVDYGIPVETIEAAFKYEQAA